MNERLRQAREGLCLSVTYVAKCLYMDTKDLEDIESGTRDVTGIELVVFSRLYGIPAEELKNGHTYDEKDLRMLAGLTRHDGQEVMNLVGSKKRLAAAM